MPVNIPTINGSVNRIMPSGSPLDEKISESAGRAPDLSRVVLKIIMPTTMRR